MNSQKCLDLKKEHCSKVEFKELLGWKRYDITQ